MGKIRPSVLKRIVQLRVYNPLYLDKTGQYIFLTKEKLENWRGGVKGFVFESNNGIFTGGLSVDDFNFSTETQSSHDEIMSFFLENYDNMLKVYENFDVQRLGYRIIYVDDVTKEEVFRFLKTLYNDEIVQKFGKPNGYEATLIIKENNIFCVVRLLYGKWKKDSKEHGGLIVDVDVFEEYEPNTKATEEHKEIFEKFFEEARRLHDHVIKVVREMWKHG